MTLTGAGGAGQPLVVAGQGTWSVDTATGDVTFTPEAGFTGAPTPVTYTVEDTAGNVSNTATITLTDTAAPVASDDSASYSGAAATVAVVSNDGNGEALDGSSVVQTNPPAGATLSADGKTLTVPGQGAWTVDAVTGALT